MMCSDIILTVILFYVKIVCILFEMKSQPKINNRMDDMEYKAYKCLIVLNIWSIYRLNIKVELFG